MERRWIIPSAKSEPANGIDWPEICDLPCIAELLKRKGFTSSDEVQNFLYPRLRSLGDPFFLPGMTLAVHRILHAVDGRERIVLFGDYDVDGVTSLALLSEMLQSYGATTQRFLPLRMEEGYGLSPESLDRCREQHDPQLLIAVDCGTSSIQEVAELKRQGIDVIILDHHEPKSAVPNCVALVNPKTATQSEFDYLCSVGIVFKLCHALLKTRPVPGFDLKASLDLVALGTVADIVPLRSENRIFVHRGMEQIMRTRRPGLRKLLEVSAVRKPMAAEDIAFRLGPRLNASGRLATAENALELLLTRDEGRAAHLAVLLDEQNRERQSVEKKVLDEAEEEIGRNYDADDAAIIVGARQWHPGVLGIVASRLSRKYHRPTIVVSFDSIGVGKGSSRSIDGFSLVEALGRCQKWLQKFGGHEMAAGLTVAEKDFPEFADAFRRTARELLSDDNLQPSLRVDHELSFSQLNNDLLHWQRILEPFGCGNPQPLFFARAVEQAAAPRFLKDKHLVLHLRQDKYFRRAIFFGGGVSPLPRSPWDVAFRVCPDDYAGETRLQIQIEALRESAPAT